MTNYLKLLIALMLTGCVFAGDLFDHSFFAFQHLNKPLSKITLVDHTNAVMSHALVDGAVGENGKNLMIYQAAFYFAALAKAESKGMGKQWKMAARDGFAFDFIDKLLTAGVAGGVIQSQLGQIPVVGDYLCLMIPHLLNDEIIHNVVGYPRPAYNMSEEQHFYFRCTELAIFWLECDYLHVKNNQIYAEVKF
jgi:hypothetical protein